MIFFSEGKLMNKLIAALIAGAFAFGSVAAMAQGGAVPQGDKTPPQPVDQQQLKEQRAKAKAAYANMTPEEKAAYKKAKAAQKQKAAMDAQAQATNNPPTTPAETNALKADKSQPKAITSKDQRQDALKQTEKAPGAGGGN
jgi:hypothetical protein